jgi:hypothetical protein
MYQYLSHLLGLPSPQRLKLEGKSYSIIIIAAAAAAAPNAGELQALPQSVLHLGVLYELYLSVP